MISEHDLERHRPALLGHCYRMTGSAADADDAVQETMIRAWRGRESFEERAALGTWLYRIATRVCIDALGDRRRRTRPPADGPVGTVEDELTARPASHWVEPIADVHALPVDGDPAERAALRQSIRLAFVAALQHLPPKQRAALLLADVLGWRANEVAETLDTSVASVNSALQRARAKVAELDPSPTAAPGDESAWQPLLGQYVAAFERYDVDALVALLRDDVSFSMPPYALWLRGRGSVRAWLLGRGAGCRGSRLLPSAANGWPAFGQYRASGPGGRHEPWGLVVLEIDGDRVAGWNTFLDAALLFPRFGLPRDPND